MTTLENFVSPALTRALGWTLLHSLWQGALVAAVLAGALLLLRRQRAEVRYVASAGALGMVVALAGITFGLYFNSTTEKGSVLRPGTVQTERSAVLKQAEAPEISVSNATEKAVVAATPRANALHKNRVAADAPAASVAQAATPNWLAIGLRYFDNHLPLLVVAWMLGLLAMSLRMLGGLLYVQRLRNYRVRPLSAAWQERLAALAARSSVRRPVALLESALVQVPLVVGHWRPVILLPLGTVAGLTPAYLEAILAHELAHVLRRDYLVNLLQTVAEVLFFYHPAVWFVANCVRTERENCCDDTATALVGGDPLRLARALTALAEWTQSAVVPSAPHLALAAMGKRNALLNRVRRLVQRRPAAPTLGEGIMAGALVLGGLGLLGSSVALAGPLQVPAAPQKPAAFDWQTGPAQTAPKPTSDTTKRTTATTNTTTSTTTATVPPLPAPPEPPQEIRREMIVKDGPDTDDDQPGQDRPRPKRKVRRVVVNGREMGSDAFSGNPGTVVITKDKKGRVTDLVVNGQHIDAATENGKGKLKIKDKKGKRNENEQVQVIQVMPQFSPDPRVFVYHGDARDQRQLEREVERNMARSFNYQFRFPELDKQQAEKNYAEKQSDERFSRDFNKNFNKSFNKSYNGNFNKNFNQNFRVGTSGNAPEVEALRAAERALREASNVKSLSTEQRKRINKELENVRTQLHKAESTTVQRKKSFGGNMREDTPERQQALQEQQQELQERIQESQLELRDLLSDREQTDRKLERYTQTRQRQQELRARQQELQQQIRDAQMVMSNQWRADQQATGYQLRADVSGPGRAERDREQADRKRERADRERERAERRREQDDALIAQLLKDGLIKDKDNFQLRLTATTLTVNGKEQSKKLQEKYLKLFESTHPDRKMGPKGAMVITRNSDSSNSNFDESEGPRPPRAPRPPKAPKAALPPLPPVAPMAPVAPPAPPTPPQIDTESLRDELRKDGVIGAGEKDFQFQLNASGLTVNGKKQSDELANKYRKMTGHDNGKKFNVTISTQE